MEKMKLKNSYDNFEEASNETGLECKDPTLTQQHDEHDANINNIVKKYLGTGVLTTHNMPPLQGDFTAAPDMQTAMNLGIQARDAFMEQPAEVRAQFQNDPAQFVAFCSDPDNKDAMFDMGLLNETAGQKILDARTLANSKRERDQADAEAYRKLMADKAANK